MAKIGTENVSILGEWHKIGVHYNSRFGFFAKPPSQYPDFMQIVGNTDNDKIQGVNEDEVRRKIRVYAKDYALKLPKKRHVLIIRHRDARETKWGENRREVDWHGFHIEWSEAFMVGKTVFSADMKNCSSYIKLENEAVIDFTPERVKFLTDLVAALDRMSDSVEKFVGSPVAEITQIIDNHDGRLLLKNSS